MTAPRHAHLAAVPGGVLATVGSARTQVGLPGDALEDASTRARVRDALEARLGRLVTWPDGAGAGTVLGAPDRVWWFGGAWFGCRAADADAARRVVRTHAPDLPTRAAWEAPGLSLDLPVATDPDLDRVREAVAELRPGLLVRGRDGLVSLHALRPWPALDEVTGAARRIGTRPAEPGLPTAFRHVHALLPRTELGWPTWQPDRLAPAAAFDDDAAHESALASAVAHLAGPWTGASPTRSATPVELAAAGEAYLDPAGTAVTDPAVVTHPGSPLTPLDVRRPVAWVRGHRGATAAPVWVPLQDVHTHVEPPPVPDQAPAGYHNLAGMAAARSRREAVERAFAHVVSHDAVARWWRWAEAPPPGVLPVPRSLRDRWAGATVTVELRRLPSRFDADVVLAVVRDPERGVLALGHAAGADAAEQAALSALVQLVTARDLAGADGRIRAAVAAGAGTVPGLLAHRPARDYLDLAPALPGVAVVAPRPAVLDPMAHLQLGLDPRVLGRVEERLAGGRPEGPAGRPSRRAGAGPTTDAVHVLTTPPPLAGNGWESVRVLVPGCLRLEPAAFPVPGPASGEAEQVPYPGW